MTKHIFALLLVLALAHPALAQNREHQQMAADARMLQEQVQQLSLAVAALSQLFGDSLKALNARLDQSSAATVKGFADQKLLIDNIGSDTRIVRENSADTNVRLGSLNDEIEALRATVLAFQEALAAAQRQTLAPPLDPNAPPLDPNAPAPAVPAPGAAPVAGQPAPAAPAVPSTAGLSPQRMYDQANGDYFAGQFATAIAGFEAFLRAFPRVELSDDAYFNIGEANRAMNRWPEAIAAYNQVIQNYPTQNSVPNAYYGRGMAQERNGDVAGARASWEALIKAFPDSTAAIQAKQNLDRTGPAAQAR